MRRSAFAVVLFSAIIAVGMAQNPPVPGGQPAAAPGAARGGGRGFGGGAVRSPEVAADGRVTFRLRAPNAKEVFVTGAGQRLAMQKNDQGVWSVTTEPLKADVYFYSFSVDGFAISDPGNKQFKSNYGTGGQSMLAVGGNSPWAVVPGVARGAVARHFYHSAAAGDDRDFWVYTPPNYDPKRKEAYPTLYLGHGIGDDSNSWTENGQAHIILDNLIAQGKAKPMVMVNALGYSNAGGSWQGQDFMPKYARTIIEEIMPQVEKQYNVSKKREDRAIAGLSMGGAEATFTGLNNLDKFAWVGSFSGAYVMWPRDAAAPGAAPAAPAAAPAPAQPPAGAGRGAAPGAPGAGGRGGQSLDTATIAKSFPKLDSKANAQLRLLWISCGTTDSLLGVNQQFMQYLKSKNVNYVYREYPDLAHVWTVWRDSLASFAPLLFQQKAKSSNTGRRLSSGDPSGRLRAASLFLPIQSVMGSNAERCPVRAVHGRL
jgi:enterochelin esterase-like enzyme